MGVQYNNFYVVCPQCGSPSPHVQGDNIVDEIMADVFVPDDLSRFSANVIRRVRQEISDKVFYCPDCEHSFVPYPGPGESSEQRQALIKELFR